MTVGEPLLVATDVAKSFGGVRAVDGAGFSVRTGSISALIGPNGAGKTTMFNLVTGFSTPDSGIITFDGRRVDGTAPHRLAQRGLCRTFQGAKVIQRLSVLDNVMVAGKDHPGERLSGFLRPGATARREGELRDRAVELLTLVRLDTLASAYAGTLSGGQRKLLDLARSLMMEPRMLLLDEPMAGVNPALSEQLMDTLRSLRDDRGLTLLLVEHDHDAVMSIADQVIVMGEGRVIADGTADEVRNDQRVIDAYLGAPA